MVWGIFCWKLWAHVTFSCRGLLNPEPTGSGLGEAILQGSFMKDGFEVVLGVKQACASSSS